jgi:hypothetical protein
MIIEWNALKSANLKRIRDISFEEIIKEELVGVLRHPTKLNQWILVFKHKNYCWAVPSVLDGEKIFLKTIYPSRKMTKRYLKKEE